MCTINRTCPLYFLGDGGGTCGETLSHFITLTLLLWCFIDGSMYYNVYYMYPLPARQKQKQSILKKKNFLCTDFFFHPLELWTSIVELETEKRE
jgi:hypothetical protein